MLKDLAKFLVPLAVAGITFFLFNSAFYENGVAGLVDEEVMIASIVLAVILGIVTFIILKNILIKQKK